MAPTIGSDSHATRMPNVNIDYACTMCWKLATVMHVIAGRDIRIVIALLESLLATPRP